MLSESINQLALFLGRLSPISSWPVFVHFLSPVTNNCTFLISRKGRMAVETISWSISTKFMWPCWYLNLQPLDLQSDSLTTAPWNPVLQCLNTLGKYGMIGQKHTVNSENWLMLLKSVGTFMSLLYPQLQIRPFFQPRSTDIFRISSQKHVLWVLIRKA